MVNKRNIHRLNSTFDREETLIKKKVQLENRKPQ